MVSFLFVYIVLKFQIFLCLFFIRIISVKVILFIETLQLVTSLLAITVG